MEKRKLIQEFQGTIINTICALLFFFTATLAIQKNDISASYLYYGAGALLLIAAAVLTPWHLLRKNSNKTEKTDTLENN